MHIRDSQKERFWHYVDKTDDCWLWTGAIVPSGYGHFVVDWDGAFTTTTRRAHRVVYEMEVGPIEDGMTIDHLCGVKHCVRPDHLEQVSRGENARRGNRYVVCKSGRHPLVGDNVVIRPSRPQNKECRACANEAARRRRQAK